MKKAIVYLGIFTALATYATYANTTQQHNIGLVTSSQETLNSTSPVLTKPAILSETVGEVSQNILALTVNKVKPVEQLIQENKLITDAPEEVYQPLSVEDSADYRIKFDNQIIENNQTDEVYPLNINYYNQSQSLLNNLELKTREALKS